jgi:hypothetical protein
MDRLQAWPGTAAVLVRGDTKTSVRGPRDVQVDLRVVDGASFGAALQYFTGSKEHNVRLRGRARDRGLTINEYGVYRIGKDGEAGTTHAARGKAVAGATEESVYEAVGLPWVPPELREGGDEIDLAERGGLPRLVEIGDMGERLSHIRDTLLVLQRAMPFIIEHGDGWMDANVKGRLKMASGDVTSLNEYEVHLTDKLQFLLDATLGFINIAQNNVMKVMAIASVVGIPPVLIAGIYGMNFKNIPEYDWEFGYLWGWGLILLTTLIPLAAFRWKKWI